MTKYSWFIHSPWYCMDALLVSFIPFNILIVGSSMTIVKVVTSRCSSRTSSSTPTNGTRMASTTVILIRTSLVFVMLNAPRDVYFIGMSNGRWDAERFVDVSVTHIVVLMLTYINASLNLVMFMSGSKFRKAFKSTVGDMSLAVRRAVRRRLAAVRNNVVCHRDEGTEHD